MNNDYKIAVIGFGYIGSVIGAVLADKGMDVVGIEKNKYIIECIQNKKSPFTEEGLDSKIKTAMDKGRLTVSNDYAELSGCNVFIITVGTPLSNELTADLSHLTEACNAVKPYAEDGAVIIIKSTVPPFTTKNVVAPIFEGKNTYISFCPERLAEGKAILEFESIPIVIGGVDDKSGTEAEKFWSLAMGNETILVKTSTEAEMVKLADNLWIDLNIALAHELSFISDRMNIDVIDVIKAANSLPKGMHHVNILTPSVGVGGYCLTKDPWFVDRLGKSYGINLKLPSASRNINDMVPEYSALMIDEILTKKYGGIEKSKLKIAVLGIAFKNDTGDCRFSPTKGFIDKIIDLGYEVDICDPLVLPHDKLMITDKPLNDNIMDTISNANCVAFLTGHKIFKEINMYDIANKLASGAVIFDGRRYFNSEEIKEIYKLGLEFKGVGR